MKLRYRNITVPYFMYDANDNYSYYIYNDKKYSDLNELFKDFIGLYLIYHFEVKDKEREVHNLSEVVEELVKNPDTFKISDKYKEEYSDDEYKYITKLQEKIINNNMKIYDSRKYQFNYSKSEFGSRKKFNFEKEIYDKYKDVKIPKKIHSDIYDKDYFVVAGRAYETIFGALDEVFIYEMYYQFGGSKRENNQSHSHAHEFEEVIRMIFDNNSKFKIHVFQRQFYSKQELIFLEKLSQKLRDMKYKSVVRKYEKSDWEEYCYLKDNNKYLSLLINNIKFYLKDKKFAKDKLKSHKI